MRAILKFLVFTFFCFTSINLQAQPTQSIVVDLFRSVSFGSSTELDAVLGEVASLFETQIGLKVVFRDNSEVGTNLVGEANLQELMDTFKEYYRSNRPDGSDIGIWVTATPLSFPLLGPVYSLAIEDSVCSIDPDQSSYGVLSVVSGNSDFNYVSLAKILALALNGGDTFTAGFISSSGIGPATSPMPTEFSSTSVAQIQTHMHENGSCLDDGVDGPQEKASPVRQIRATVMSKNRKKITLKILSIFGNGNLVADCNHRLVFLDSQEDTQSYVETYNNSTLIERFTESNKTLKTGENARLYKLQVSRAPRSGGVAVLSACHDGQSISPFTRIRKSKGVKFQSIDKFKTNFISE